MIRTIVVDASVALKLVLPEPGSDRAHALQRSSLHAPDLLLVECANALSTMARRKVLTRAVAEECFERLATGPVTLSPSGGLARSAMRFALDLGHPVYDCIYLALAAQLGTSVVTADVRLLAAVRAQSAWAGLAVPL